MIIQLTEWFDRTIIELRRHFRWSFLPPLMVYFAAGISGITGIVGAFFVKDYLDLSAAFLAGLTFWVGLPWALKMPIGHLVDIIWRWKALLVYFGASLIAASLLIMYGLVTAPTQMAGIMPVETWYVLSVLLAPCGYVVQDAVADAMSVEAVPVVPDLGDLPTIVQHESNGLLYPAGDTAALVDALDRIAVQSAFRRSLGGAARETARGRSWTAVASGVLDSIAAGAWE